MSALLVLAAPCGATTVPVQGIDTRVQSELTHQQLRVFRAYERYQARVAKQRRQASRVVRFAYRQLGKPYRWGGAGPRSYDCSGLAMAAWRRAGLRLPHRADLQHRVIRRKVPLRRLRPGDLVFFSGNRHVGIYIGHHRFIHAPHTGTVVQRGVLTGWRRRAFAGAARPGAPAYRSWPRWIRALVAGAAHRAAAPPPEAPEAQPTPDSSPTPAVSSGSSATPPESPESPEPSGASGPAGSSAQAGSSGPAGVPAASASAAPATATAASSEPAESSVSPSGPSASAGPSGPVAMTPPPGTPSPYRWGVIGAPSGTGAT